MIARHVLYPLLLCLACAGLAVACSDEGGGATSGGGDADAESDAAGDLEGDPDASTGDLGDDPDAASTADPDIDEPTPPEISNLTATENPSNALSFFVGWETDEPATTSLTFECGEDDPGATIASEDLVTSHEVFIMGLLETTTCTVTVTSVDEGGLSSTDSAEVTTADLPDASFPLATLTTDEPERVQPGWTLIPLINHFDSEVLRVALIDSLGRYRWYHRSSFNHSGADSDVRAITGGVLIGGIPATRPQIVDWDGSLRWQGTLPMHHHITLWPDDEHVFFIQARNDDTCELEFKGYAIATIQNIETDEIVWEWSLCNHYTPSADIRDWEHANTLEPFPGESAFLASPRNQNSVVRINRDTEEVEWVLGFAGRPQDGFNGDFAMAEEDRFYHQHAPEIQPNGNILLYDNGLVGHREETRAIEIAYDEEAMTAEVVWEYRHDPPSSLESGGMPTCCRTATG